MVKDLKFIYVICSLWNDRLKKKIPIEFVSFTVLRIKILYRNENMLQKRSRTRRFMQRLDNNSLIGLLLHIHNRNTKYTHTHTYTRTYKYIIKEAHNQMTQNVNILMSRSSDDVNAHAYAYCKVLGLSGQCIALVVIKTMTPNQRTRMMTVLRLVSRRCGNNLLESHWSTIVK